MNIKQEMKAAAGTPMLDPVAINESVKMEVFVDEKVHNISKHSPKKEDPGKKRYECSGCGGVFKHKRFLKRHIRKNSREESYECAMCAYKTTCKTTLINHISLHVSENNYECEFCGFISVYKVGFIAHLKSHAEAFGGAKSKRCSTCGFKAIRDRDFENHVKIRRGEPYRCSVCGYKANQICAMQVHTRSTHDAPYECAVCGFKTIRSRELTMHVTIHIRENPQSCSICGYTTEKNCDLKEHMKTHTDEKNTCAMCGARFGRLSDLNRHIRSHNNVRLYKCSACEYKATDVANLRHHLIVHAGAKPYECSICGFKTKYFHTLRKHTNSRRCVKGECPDCQFKTTNTEEMVKHQRTHNINEVYKCSVCKFETVYKRTFLSHMSRHIAETPYKCSVCGYKAANKWKLKKHKTVHAEGKPHENLYKAYMLEKRKKAQIELQRCCGVSKNINEVNVKKESDFESHRNILRLEYHDEDTVVKAEIPDNVSCNVVDVPVIEIKREIEVEPYRLQPPDIVYKAEPKLMRYDGITKSESNATRHDGNETEVTVKREEETT